MLLTHIIYMRYNSAVPCKTKQTLRLPLGWKEKTQTEEAEMSAEHLQRLFLYLLGFSVKLKGKAKFSDLRKTISREGDREKKPCRASTMCCVMFDFPDTVAPALSSSLCHCSLNPFHMKDTSDNSRPGALTRSPRFSCHFVAAFLLSAWDGG